jgi:hypothetical protein
MLHRRLRGFYLRGISDIRSSSSCLRPGSMHLSMISLFKESKQNVTHISAFQHLVCPFLVSNDIHVTIEGKTTHPSSCMSFNSFACSPACLKSPIFIYRPGRTAGSHRAMYLAASLYCVALMHSSTKGWIII